MLQKQYIAINFFLDILYEDLSIGISIANITEDSLEGSEYTGTSIYPTGTPTPTLMLESSR